MSNKYFKKYAFKNSKYNIFRFYEHFRQRRIFKFKENKILKNNISLALWNRGNFLFICLTVFEK